MYWVTFLRWYWKALQYFFQGMKKDFVYRTSIFLCILKYVQITNLIWAIIALNWISHCIKSKFKDVSNCILNFHSDSETSKSCKLSLFASKFLRRLRKQFVIEKDGKPLTISIDRIKPFFSNLRTNQNNHAAHEKKVTFNI